MDVLVEKLDAKIRELEPNVAARVREQISEIIDLADQICLNIMRSLAVEQEFWIYAMNPIPAKRSIKELICVIDKKLGFQTLTYLCLQLTKE